MLIQKQVSLAQFSTFQVGGLAEYFAEIQTKDDLLEAILWLEQQKEKVALTILGGCSNVLISDSGLKGLVLKMSNKIIQEIDATNFICGAGCALRDIAILVKEKELSGLEWSWGIPQATLGGSIRGNAGAFNKTISEIVKEVECFDLEKKQFVIKKNFDCGFSYRQSIFKKEKKYIIWQAKLNFIKTNKEEIESNMSNNINYRLERHPKEFSAGSVFKNLLADEILQKNKDLYLELEKQGLIRGEKIGVAYLIEKAGLKGKSIGGAQVSNKHANFIVNNNSATANDIKELIAFVKKEFFNKYNLVLEEELQYLGF